MKKSIRAFISAALTLVALNQSAHAVVYTLPAGKGNIVGQNLELTIPADNKLPLEAFATQYQMGLSNILEANPKMDVYLPKAGAPLIIPQQLILPDAPRQGIVINSAEMRLYYYPKGTNTVVVLPIGIGQLGKDTPLDWTTAVEHKRPNPTWTPTAKMHQEYADEGKNLPTVLPAGPDNPMGLYALYIGRLYAIHGTNADFGIGLRVSHGCVRLRAEDIKWLFENVPVGTRVQFINQPVKAAIEPDGSRYLEVHNPLSTTEQQFTSNEVVPISLTAAVSQVLSDPSVNQQVVNKALQRRSGMPNKVNDVADAIATTALPISEQTDGQPVEGPNSHFSAQGASQASTQ